MQEEVQHMFSLSKAFFSLSKDEKSNYAFNLVCTGLSSPYLWS